MPMASEQQIRQRSDDHHKDGLWMKTSGRTTWETTSQMTYQRSTALFPHSNGYYGTSDPTSVVLQHANTEHSQSFAAEGVSLMIPIS